LANTYTFSPANITELYLGAMFLLDLRRYFIGKTADFLSDVFIMSSFVQGVPTHGSQATASGQAYKTAAFASIIR
jgi:hypothetical protein